MHKTSQILLKYIFTTTPSELKNRLAVMKSLNPITLLQLQNMVKIHNPFYAVFNNNNTILVIPALVGCASGLVYQIGLIL